MAALSRSLMGSRVAHAYLFVGPEGVGKRYMALSFAKALNCLQLEADYCGHCPACQKIDRLSHPDLHLIEPEGNSLKIEQVRICQREIAFRPWEGRTKVVILDGADKMTPEAASALLKTLEEPPASTVLILTASSELSLLPTITSRCRLIRLGPLDRAVIAEILVRERLLEPSQASLLASLAQGRLGKALSLDLKSTLELRDQAWRLLEPPKGSPPAIFLLQAARERAKERESLAALLSMLALLVRDLVVSACRAEDPLLLNGDLASQLKALTQGIAPRSALKIWDAIVEAQRLFQQNANGQLLLEATLARIYHILGYFEVHESGARCQDQAQR